MKHMGCMTTLDEPGAETNHMNEVKTWTKSLVLEQVSVEDLRLPQSYTLWSTTLPWKLPMPLGGRKQLKMSTIEWYTTMCGSLYP
jgi:hypothetical protein